MKHITSYFLCLLAVFLFCSNGLCREAPSAQTTAVTVQVETVRETTRQPQVELVATIEPVRRAAIAARVTGTITKLPVVLGSRVKRGDLLVGISAREIASRVVQAKAQRDQARRNLKREQKLLKKNASTSETVKSLQDQYTMAEAAFQEATTLAGYTTITAPFDGVITQKMVNPGDLATPGMVLLKLEDETELQAVAAVPESLINRIKAGDKFMVQVPSADLTITGTVTEIGPAADPLSRTAPVKIDLEPNPALRTGQFARVILPLDTATTLLIPESAVVAFGQMNKVFVLKDGHARLRLVRTGGRTGQLIEILAGLNPGEQIIVNNNRLLINGQPVTVR